MPGLSEELESATTTVSEGEDSAEERGAEKETETEDKQANAWGEGFSEEDVKYLANKGFQSTHDIYKSYRELEGFVGKKNSIVEIPSPEDEEKMQEFYDRLGRPEKPEGYEIEVDGAEEGDPEYDEAAFEAEVMSESFHKAGLNKDQAAIILEGQAALQEVLEEEEAAAMEEETEIELNEVRKEWGESYDANKALAQRGVAYLGLETDAIDGLNELFGARSAMNMLKEIGELTSEHNYLGGRYVGKGFSRESAGEELKDLQNDDDFRARLLSGDVAAKKKWEQMQNAAFAPRG